MMSRLPISIPRTSELAPTMLPTAIAINRAIPFIT